jgi:hypothetical protein
MDDTMASVQVSLGYRKGTYRRKSTYIVVFTEYYAMRKMQIHDSRKKAALLLGKINAAGNLFADNFAFLRSSV